MSKYTDAHFAATLLECGPHMTGTLIEGPYMHPYSAYRERIFNHWCKLFPEYRNGDGHIADWLLFWREYIGWVKS
jgi:hypothetical protein